MREFKDYKEIVQNNQGNKQVRKFFELDPQGTLDEEVNDLLISLKKKISKIDNGSLLNKIEVILLRNLPIRF